MTTLITAGNSEGIYGRCDAKCYNATGGSCHCICGGMNHGQGEATARELTATMTDAMLRAIEAKGGSISAELRQGQLV